MRTPLIALLLTLALPLMANHHPQQQHERKEFSPEAFNRHMEQFITERASLTADEAAAFFPLMHEMLAKQRANNDQQRQLMEKCEPTATEHDYEQAVMRSIELEAENKNIERTYYQRFHAVLSWEKIHKVKNALVEFQMEALRRFAPPQQHNNRDFRHWQWGEKK